MTELMRPSKRWYWHCSLLQLSYRKLLLRKLIASHPPLHIEHTLLASAKCFLCTFCCLSYKLQAGFYFFVGHINADYEMVSTHSLWFTHRNALGHGVWGCSAILDGCFVYILYVLCVCSTVTFESLQSCIAYPTLGSVKGLKIIHLNIESWVPKTDLLCAWNVLHKPIITFS